ncbi:DMT family transporter [Paenibacillus sp.]|uniref:DMT family transporter n=1 Tax=Paenibacillus sp. TaxID=58172 RepID=UPI002811043C|nr:DMT family transporter [Paenibacillus sp.]
MILGILWAALSGALVGVQNLFNNRVNEHTSVWTTTTLVLGLGFAASLAMGLVFEGGELLRPKPMQTWFWFSGLIGVGVVVCMVQGLRRLGPTSAVLTAMTSQLGFAMIWDAFGWFGLDRVPITPTRLIGALAIAGGLFLFQLGGVRNAEAAVPPAAEAEA